jgi:hypothetical protein
MPKQTEQIELNKFFGIVRRCINKDESILAGVDALEKIATQFNIWSNKEKHLELKNEHLKKKLFYFTSTEAAVSTEGQRLQDGLIKANAMIDTLADALEAVLDVRFDIHTTCIPWDVTSKMEQALVEAKIWRES